MSDFLDAIFNRLPDDPLRSIKTVASSPGQFLKGATLSTAKALVQSLGHNAANLLQSYMPPGYNVPYATEHPLTPLDRLRVNTSAASLGLTGLLQNKIEKELADNQQNSSFEEKTLDVLKGAKNFVLDDILPVGNAMKVITGKSEGQALNAEQIGQALTGGILQAIPVVGVVGKLAGRLSHPAAYTAEVASVAKKIVGRTENAKFQELKAAGEEGASAGEILDIAKAPGFEPRIPAKTPEQIAAELDNLTGPRADYAGFVKDGYTQDIFDKVVHQTAYSKIFKDLEVARIAQNEAFERGTSAVKPTMVYENVMLALKNGALDPPVLTKYAEKFNLPIDKVGDYLADGVRVYANFYGQGLQVLSDVSRYNGFETFLNIISGDKPAIAKFRAAMKHSDLTLDKINNVQQLKTYVNNGIRSVESFRRGLLVSLPRTAWRNALAQGLTHVGDTLDQMNTKAWQYAFKKFGGEEYSVGQYMERSFGDIFDWPDKEGVEALVHEYPTVGATIKNETSNQVGQAMMTDMVKQAAPQGAGEWAGWLANKATTLTRLQERTIRTWVFGQRLGQNIKQLGFNDVKTFLKDAQDKALKVEAMGEDSGAMMANLDMPHKMAIADAMIHSLKQTYAYTPKNGFWSEILKFYNANPWMTAIGPTFPRFLANQYRFIMEHNPANLTKLFSKKYRAKLFDKNGEFYSTRAAWDEVGKATTGIGMLTTAYAIRNSDLAGANYYEIQHKDGTVFDTRAYQPFNSYMFMAHIMEKAFKDEPLNLSPNELSDAIAGVRRMSDVPVFAVQDLFRAMTSEDPETRRRPWAKLSGNYLSGFMQPFRVLNESYGVVKFYTDGRDSASEALAQRDIQTQELTGPSRSAIAAVTDLPKKIDPFTGDIRMPQTAWGQFKQTMFGVNTTVKSPLQDLIERNGVEAAALLPKYDNPALNNEVARRMGMILSSKLGNGRTVNEELAANIKAKGFTREMNQFIIEEALSEIKKAIMPSLEADPRYGPFLAAEQIKHSSELRPIAKPAVEKLQQNFPALGWK